MEKWFIKNNGVDFNKISKDLNISPFLSKLLVNRDITDYSHIRSFLDPKLEKLHNPIDMKDLINGIFILRDDIIQKNKIRIVGDYDVDGVMSVYILYMGIKNLGGLVDYEIPDRVEDGYGINESIVRKAKEDGVKTIITCDNGISAVEAVKLSNELKMKIIVTDHHDLPYVEKEGVKEHILVTGDAVVNPKREDCHYPFKLLCGAGVAYKLIQQLYLEFNKSIEDTNYLLEFAGIATICDVVDLIDENRIIVKYGLELLNRTENIGMKALIKETRLEDKEIGVYHVGFIIGPCINASGRLDSAKKALDLFLTEDEVLAEEFARELKELNDDRKEMTNKGVEEVIKIVETTSIGKDKILVIYEPSIHESIAGIIAGRIKDRYNKPTIVLTDSKDMLKGSGRSIEEYNMFEGLVSVKDLLGRFGGHPMAAGLSIEKDKLETLRLSLNENNSLTEDDLIPKKYMDLPLGIGDINFQLIECLNELEPFGKGNSKPLFGAKDLKVERAYILGANRNTVKLLLKDKNNLIIEGLLFGNVDEFERDFLDSFNDMELEKLYNGLSNDVYIDLIYYPGVNEYMGKKTLQVIIKSYRF